MMAIPPVGNRTPPRRRNLKVSVQNGPGNCSRAGNLLPGRSIIAETAIALALSAMPLRQTRHQMAVAGGTMPMPSNRSTVVGYRFIAFLDHVWLYVGVLRTRHLITLTCHKTAVEAHCRRGSDDFATVVSVITDAYEIDHDRTILLNEQAICSGNKDCQSLRACFRGDSASMFFVDRYFSHLSSQMFRKLPLRSEQMPSVFLIL